MPQGVIFAAAAVSVIIVASSVAESFQLQSFIRHGQAHALLSTPLNAIANPPISPGYAEEEKTKARPRHGRDVVKRIDNIEEYKVVVVDETEKISVVRFYANWCKTCKAAEPQFYKLAAEYNSHGVQFVEVPLTRRNAYLHEGLGVPTVPWVHIYHPEVGLCEERKLSKKHVQNVRRCLECYVFGCCNMDDEECLLI